MNNSKKFKTPILVIAWKRPEKTKELLNKIKLINPNKVYFACDGPKNKNLDNIIKVEKTRAILLDNDEINYTKYLFSKNNQGCKNGVTNAINWFFENEEEGIILEDDCIPHLDFFKFCEEMLDKYRTDKRIWSITGHNQQDNIQRGNGTYYFSKYPRSWGWATWKRSWLKYDRDIKDWPNIKKSCVLNNQLIYKNELMFWENTLDNIYHHNSPDTWDYQWTLSSFLNSGLTVVPNKNLIKNIGLDDEATHTFAGKSQTKFNQKKIERNIIFPTIHPKYFITDKKADNIVDILEYSGGNKLSIKFIRKKIVNIRFKIFKSFKKFIKK